MFLNKLSKAINLEIEGKIPELMPPTDIFDITPTCYQKQKESIPTVPINDINEKNHKKHLQIFHQMFFYVYFCKK